MPPWPAPTPAAAIAVKATVKPAVSAVKPAVSAVKATTAALKATTAAVTSWDNMARYGRRGGHLYRGRLRRGSWRRGDSHRSSARHQHRCDVS
jgi:hypothetical protein